MENHRERKKPNPIEELEKLRKMKTNRGKSSFVQLIIVKIDMNDISACLRASGTNSQRFGSC
jgi:hypothetical protein